MRLIFGTLTALSLCVAAPAVAQASAMVPGMHVTDSSGASVGTVKAVQGSNLLIQTDKHEVLLPTTSFTVSNGKLLFGMTQAQLDAQVEKSLAARSASIVAGATVKGSAGTPVGTIDSVEGGNVTIALQDGKKIAVPQAGLRGNTDGTVTIGYSAAQLQALTQASTSSPEAASSPETATSPDTAPSPDQAGK